MNREGRAAIKVHNTAIAEGEKYANEHGHSLTEEISYGRGFKAGYMLGAVETEQEVIEKAAKWIENNIKFMHPRKETEVCAVNIGAFKDYMMDDNL